MWFPYAVHDDYCPALPHCCMLLLNACCSLLPVACWCGRADGAVGQAVTRPRARLRAARGGGLNACFCNPQLLRFRGGEKDGGLGVVVSIYGRMGQSETERHTLCECWTRQNKDSRTGKKERMTHTQVGKGLMQLSCPMPSAPVMCVTCTPMCCSLRGLGPPYDVTSVWIEGMRRKVPLSTITARG